jgi:peptidoglycan/xylan/chitin deacetylase (PgdA/CDA1 family)
MKGRHAGLNGQLLSAGDRRSPFGPLHGMTSMATELVLGLHGIGSPNYVVPTGEAPYWITNQAFISLIETVAAMGVTSRLPITITFDDGNESDAMIALPELAKRDLKASFFVVAARIGMPHYLDRQALADLISTGMEIGTHGMTHCDWRKLDDGKLQIEIADARSRIEDICGIGLMKASIPFGSYDRRVLNRLRRERFECVYTSDGGLAHSGAWLKGRQSIKNTTSEENMKCLLSTDEAFTTRLRRSVVMIYKRLR